MKLVDLPEVFLIGEPMINLSEMMAYLRKVGGEDWFRKAFPKGMLGRPEPNHSEALTEFMGRLCYRSWEPGLNKNVTKIREDRGDYLLNVLRSGHGSVIEHCTFNFVIHNCSRVMTAELNRHRVGIAISEQSLRYVRLDDLPFRNPPTLSSETINEGEELIGIVEEYIARFIAREITDDMKFSEKKEKTSAIRRYVPMGIATEEGWSANVRAIRHVISMRSAAGAEEEIRIFADQVARIMQGRCPLLFGDYEAGELADTVPEWVTPYHKV